MRHLYSAPQEGLPIVQGITPSLPKGQGGLWFDGENIFMGARGIFNVKGSSDFLDESADNLAQVLSSGAKTLYFISNGDLKSYANSSITTLDSGIGSGPWEMQTYGSHVAYTNGVSKPRFWDGTNAHDMDVPGNSAKILAQLGPHLVALNLGNEGQRIAWCDTDDLSEWTLVDEDKRSGALFLRDFSMPILAAEKLGDSLAIYTDHEMGVLNYLGGNFVFGFQLLLNGIGVTGPRAVVSVGRIHYGMGRHGFWRTDGTQFEYLDGEAIRQFIQEDVNWDAADKILVKHNAQDDYIEIHYPSRDSTENNRGLIYCYKSGAWSKLSYGSRAAIPRGVFDFPLEARGNSIRQSGTEDECDATAWLQSSPLGMTKPEVYKRLQGIKFGTKGHPRVHVGVADSPMDMPEFYWSGLARDKIMLADREGLYFSLKVSGTKWGLISFDLMGQYGGTAL